ncbi:maleylpyruvate isomerase family mycothiol-dependent enzyme [Salsipaludibacter albus]|uniref:maleylpyruvate isomerase family mycothiol-dependent enzyme n=1 Tax=Salsipaludibacter albus TaxID=2849650 RepID=UPI001EE3B92C|nr:maleylpyruvate isomerase family mycothiol-dependent enzyme [Salsipaludibacter albus]MBY5163632.1 maleylpyruvate isomerase family mycothiol-dependent enzyme [Salsipaludibacter albus]
MTTALDRASLWSLIHHERACLAADLDSVDAEDWRESSLCPGWTVEDVVAHLTAVATLGRWRWLTSMVGAGFDADVHNRRRLLEQRGPTPGDTLRRFRAAIDLEVAPSGHTAAWLGEVIVHGADVRHPLGIQDSTSVQAATEVARFFAQRDFTVDGRTRSRDLRLVATDGPFAVGTGPIVEGTTMALVMTMAGREPFVDRLSGPGVDVIRERTAA